MHWEERHVYSDEESPEMNFPEEIVITKPDDFLDPEISSAEDSKDSTHR